MKRNIITIDEEKCDGCGLCATACHEGAIQMVNGKARLISESYCDGLGACLPGCPTGAITIEEREADAFDEAAVAQHLESRAPKGAPKPQIPMGGCPGSRLRTFSPADAGPKAEASTAGEQPSALRQWPCQIQLVPPNAPYLQGANLLIAADCTAFANANVHSRWMHNRITLIGCPKLDDVDYSEKLADIFRFNDIQSLTILRMSVPCCGGIVQAAKAAMQQAGVMIPWQVVTLDVNGDVLE